MSNKSPASKGRRVSGFRDLFHHRKKPIMSAPLATLPPELILRIAEELDELGDRATLSQVSRRFAAILLPKLRVVTLRWAADLDEVDRFQDVLNKDVDLHYSGHWAPGLTLLEILACEGMDKYVQLLLQKGAQFSGRDSDGLTILHKAAYTGHAGVVKLLLDAGADAHALDNDDRSPLFLAIDQGHGDVVDLLLKFDSSTLSHDDPPWRPLICTAASSESVDVVKAVIAAGVNARAVTPAGRNALHFLLSRGREYTSERHEILRFLISAGVDVSAKDEDGVAPLHWAAVFGDIISFEILRDAGADLTTTCKDGGTVLHWAAEGANENLVLLLLDAGLSVFALDRFHRSPLFWALLTKEMASCMVHLLLTAGADVSLRDEVGQTVLHLAAFKGDAPAMDFLLKAGSDVNARTIYGTTPLHLAVVSGNEFAVGILLQAGIDAGIDLTARSSGFEWKTPLELAESRDVHEIAAAIRGFAEEYG